MTWARSWHMANRKGTISKHYIQFRQLQFANMIMWCAAIITLFNLIFATYANESNQLYEYWKPSEATDGHYANPKEHVAEGRSLNTQEEYNNAYRYPQYDNNNNYLDYWDYQNEDQEKFHRVQNLLSQELERFSGHPLSNNIDRQFFGIPIQLLFVLVASIVAFGGVAGQVGLFDALDDLINPTTTTTAAPAVTQAPSVNLCASVTCSVADETCSSGVCKCGTAATCSGNTAAPTCDVSNNKCICGTVGTDTSGCTISGETCDSGVCKCGTASTCDGNAQAQTCDASNNVCKCGSSAACNSPETCQSESCMCGTAAGCTTGQTCDANSNSCS